MTMKSQERIAFSIVIFVVVVWILRAILPEVCHRISQVLLRKGRVKWAMRFRSWS